ncbi:hypothetical protein BH23CHL5_BH23CHL5_28320 [soil metagenome]
MTNEPQPETDHERKRRDLEQLKASKAELTGAIARHIDWLLEMEAAGQLRFPDDMAKEPFGIAEASDRARKPLSYEPGIDPVSGRFSPGQVDWSELGNLIEHDPEKGRDVWLAIKAAARHELATGVRAADALEPPIDGRTPFRRAQYLAIGDALNEDLQPRGALEMMMIQRMAAAFEQCLIWQKIAIRRMEADTWQGERDKRRALDNMRPTERERYQNDYGWLPPRLTQHEAIHEAALMSDRYERAFLRLVREFRNARRMFAALIVSEGGTVNVSDGPQQVNIDARS